MWKRKIFGVYGEVRVLRKGLYEGGGFSEGCRWVKKEVVSILESEDRVKKDGEGEMVL